MASETFEQVLTAAQAAGSLSPAWKKFVNTKFYVAIDRSPDNDHKNFTLHWREHDGQPAVTISEEPTRIDAQPGNALVALSGAEVVRRLRAGDGILVALSDRAFSIARDRVEWLRNGIQAAQARAAEKARQAAGAFPVIDAVSSPVPAPAPVPTSPAPAPVPAPTPPAPVALAKVASAPVSLSPVQRNQVGVLDVAALKPRNITLPKIGLDFFVPSDWTETKTNTGLRFSDPDRAGTVEASGFHRPNLSSAQWLEMRLALVAHEMRYLTQDGASYPFEGESWRGRIKGMATEFTGTFPGDDVESRYLVACIWTDGVVASIAIRAPADLFERNRQLYKWLLGRVDMHAVQTTVYSPPGASLAADEWEEGETPSVFAFSLRGRLGRVRAMAYNFLMMPLAGLLGVLAAVLLPANRFVGAVVLIIAGAMLAWFGVRLMVLRMHDLNLSGKWLLAVFGLFMLAGAIQNVILLGVVAVIFAFGWLVFGCFAPGTAGENNYGPPPGPNSSLVKIGAALLILFQVGQIGAIGSGKYAGYGKTLPFPNARSGGAASKLDMPFTPKDVSFTVMLPGTPEEIKLDAGMREQLGDVELLQYQLRADNNVYMLQSINYGQSMPDDRFDALDSMQESVIGKNGVLISSTPVLMKGTTGREVKVKLPGGGIRAARFAVIGTRFCMASITAPDADKAAPAVDAFLKSFKLN